VIAVGAFFFLKVILWVVGAVVAVALALIGILLFSLFLKIGKDEPL
jgi:plastocyanin domain-containing protein